MTKTFCKSICTCVLALLLSRPPRAQALDQAALTKRMSILEDMAFLDFPDAAQHIEEIPGLTPNPLGAHDYTRILYIAGADTLMYWAVNAFQFARKNQVEWWLNANEYPDEHHQVLINRNGLLAVLMTPEAFTPGRGGILLHHLYVCTPENLTFRLSASLNSDALPRAKAYTQLSLRILSTLQAGKPDKGLSRRQEKLPIGTSNYAMVFDLPTRYHVRARETIRLHTYFVKTYTYADSSHTRAEMIVGFNEALEPHEDSETDAEPGSRDVKSSFLGNKVTWQEFHDPDHNDILKRTLRAPFPALGPNVYVDFYMYARNKQHLRVLTRIAKRIQVVER